MRILIIPDIHGRQFWRAAEEMIDDYSKVVFLGDYHDPYAFEGIKTKDSGQNFMDIVDFAQKNRDKVLLLCGNHDLSYVDGMSVGADRYDSTHEETLYEIFRDNDDLFRLAYAEDVDGTEVLFTHAGVLKTWYTNRLKGVPCNPYAIADELNTWFEEKKNSRYLYDVGVSRGGRGVGSCVWADVSEFADEDEVMPFYQIFGHTAQRKYDDKGFIVFSDPVITSRYACLDTACLYELYDGQIHAIKL